MVVLLRKDLLKDASSSSSGPSTSSTPPLESSSSITMDVRFESGGGELRWDGRVCSGGRGLFLLKGLDFGLASGWRLLGAAMGLGFTKRLVRGLSVIGGGGEGTRARRVGERLALID